MRCPFCQYQDTKVLDSRLYNEGEQIRRRRVCPECNERFTTFENIELNMPRIIKRDSTREAYNEDKLRSGILKALEKRPASSDDVEAAITRIRKKMYASSERELPSKWLGERIMDELKVLDEIAYVRFASVYRRFQDVEEFKEEIERLTKDSTSDPDSQQLNLLINKRISKPSK